MYTRGDIWLMVNHTDRIHKKIEEILEVLRAQTHMQVQVESTFMTFTDDFIKDVGVQWENLPLFSFGNQSIFGLGHIPAAVASVTYTTGAVSTGIFDMNVSFLNSRQTAMIINAAESSTNAIVTNSPHVTCLNSVSTTISLSTSVQYISTYTAQGYFVIPVMANLTYANSLSVQPWITADRRYVWLVVSPSIVTPTFTTTTVEIPVAAPTNIAGITTTATSLEEPVPLTTVTTVTNSMTATVKCPDRGTAVMGGFSNATETRTEQGVPVLSHIPVIKRLFLATFVTKNREHDLFMVTPTILIEKEFEP
jgi:type II secretory pathway component GspD/PulD (secretin)